MKEFISKNLVSIIFLLVAAILILVFWFGFRGKYKGKAKQLLLALVVAAEGKYGAGTGKLKFDYVLNSVYNIMPNLFQAFFSRETVGIWIEDAVTKMKNYLDTDRSGSP